MYSVFSTIFVILVFLVVAGFLGRVGTTGISDVSKNVAASLGLLVTYAFLILSMSSFSELATFFEGLCGGIPFLNEIADYGSMQKVISESPLVAAVAFMDTVLLSAIIEIIMLLPLGHNQNAIHFFTNVGNLMTNLLVAMLSAIVGLLILNYVIKDSSAYQWIVSVIGSIIALISVGTIPMLIVSIFKKNTTAGIGLIGTLLLFSKSKVAGILRASFLKAMVYVYGIWMLEKHFGSIANGLSQVSIVLIAFGPVVVMIMGLVIILKSTIF